MFGLTKYASKIFEIKWYFEDECDVRDIESLLYCNFEKERSKKYYTIKNISYTYVDILLGMEDLDFTFEKKNDEYIIKVKN